MISRIWRGWTTRENASSYQSLLDTEILPGIANRQIKGYRGAHLLRRDLENESEFVTILWFDSLDSLREFAGQDYEVAVVPPKARALLSRFDDRSAHYQTLLEPQ
jgi:antibiotic biosynthesis monooxygenase (ABM) superfamily enzyme